MLQSQVDRPVPLLIDDVKEILAAVRGQKRQAVDSTVYRALVQARVAILSTVQHVALVADQHFQDRRVVHSDRDEHRRVAMTIRELNQVREGRRLLYLVLEDLCELAEHFRELKMPVRNRVDES